ncbi:MAG: hypothetical protein HXX16_16370 [Bacteroidales bacterium]|nr:hypothetical protein [Bacteroidales bacterium]
MKKFKNLFIYTVICASFALYSCEGPMGPAGKDGKDGVDANETCKLCHNPASVDLISAQYELSKHSYGEAATSEAGNTGCSPCHESEAFKYVCKNNVPSTFTKITGSYKYANDYASVATAAYGEITCSTCHSSLHTTYGASDVPALTTTAAVSMTFFGGAQAINLTQKGGEGNLCVKCHQPRPFTNARTGNVLNYDSLKTFPTAVLYDGNPAGTTNRIKPGYRTHTHYGTAGAIFAGKGGVEFGSGYSNSMHTTVASCQDCHMGDMNGKAGGHTFSAIGNFNGCNVTGCHGANPISSATTSKYWKQTRDNIKSLLDQLAVKLKVGGVEILNRNPDATSNLWVGLTTNNYDGYLNVYDPINNPNGLTNNTGGTFKAASTTGFSAAQITTNNSLPVLTLTNAQMGAIINFQLCLRDYSLGIHNTAYTTTLLTNTLAALP